MEPIDADAADGAWSRPGPRMILTCYNDTFGYGWRHVDLFTHDGAGRETNWVHWTVDADGPDAADRVTAQVEPSLRRITPWRHRRGDSGMDYWEALATWTELTGP